MRGLKWWSWSRNGDSFISRTSRRCVDWNDEPAIGYMENVRRTSRRCVDWNISMFGIQLRAYVAPHVGAWIEIASCLRCNSSQSVAPHVGAWIEMVKDKETGAVKYRRTSRRCVDWNIGKTLGIVAEESRTSRRCVDWNDNLKLSDEYAISRTSRRCVDWNRWNCKESAKKTKSHLT